MRIYKIQSKIRNCKHLTKANNRCKNIIKSKLSRTRLPSCMLHLNANGGNCKTFEPKQNIQEWIDKDLFYGRNEQ